MAIPTDISFIPHYRITTFDQTTTQKYQVKYSSSENDAYLQLYFAAFKNLWIHTYFMIDTQTENIAQIFMKVYKYCYQKDIDIKLAFDNFDNYSSILTLSEMKQLYEYLTQSYILNSIDTHIVFDGEIFNDSHFDSIFQLYYDTDNDNDYDDDAEPEDFDDEDDRFRFAPYVVWREDEFVDYQSDEDY